MADATSDEPVRTEHEGVTVEKSFEPEDFPVPAIAFTVRSEREESVSVRLVDTVPEDIPSEDIGFHPQYGAEFWDVQDDTIVFTRKFEPHEEFVTVYGLRGEDTSDVERFLTEPELEAVDTVDGDSSDVVRDVLADDADDGGSDMDIDLPDLDDDDDGGVDTATTEPAGSTTPASPAGEGSVAAALAEEIRNDEVPEEDVEALRDALGVSGGDSTEARIEHLQSKFADLEAYTDALEEFLDEEGDAQSIIEDVRDDYERASDRIDDLEDDLDDVLEEVDEDLDEKLAEVREDVEAVERELETATEERIEGLEDDLDQLEDELAEVAELRDRLANALGGLAPSTTDTGGDQSGTADDAEPTDEDEADDGDAAEADDEEDDDWVPDEDEISLE